MAPQVGLEPTTLRLTAECSAIELLRKMESGSDLLSRAVSSQVPSALKGLTSVFGMGTGVTPSLSPPEWVNEFVRFASRLGASRYSVTEQSSFSSSVQLLPGSETHPRRTFALTFPSQIWLKVTAYSFAYAPRTLTTAQRFPKILLTCFPISLCQALKSSPRPISIIKLHTLPHFHR